MNRKVKRFFRRLKPSYYILFVLVVGLGLFNVITAIHPKAQQERRERTIERLFDSWWEEKGAAQFIAVGLKADEKTRQEEFDQFRERYLKQNHTFIVEDRIAEMRKEFREWWEIGGGKEQYIQDHNIYPNEKIFQNEQRKWIKNYTDKHLRYSLAFVPKDGEYLRLATCWLLFPGVLAFLLFAIIGGFAFVQTCERWGTALTSGIFVLANVAGGYVVTLLTTTSFFDHFRENRLMGGSVAIAFLLGGTAFGRTKDSVPEKIRYLAIAGLVIDILVNAFIYSGIYGAVALASLMFFGLGTIGGMKIPNRTKSEQEKNEEAIEARLKQQSAKNSIAAKKAATREQFEEGFSEFRKGHLDAALQLLTRAMTALLQEAPPDKEALQSYAERMVSPDFYIDISSAQWLEWGGIAKIKNLHETALMFLEKGLLNERNATLARRALYNIGEIRILKNVNPEEGKARLNKVIELNDKDILAVQARRLLDRIK
jgi:hypothetical protein